MVRLDYSFTSVWFMMVISIFLFVGACWIPVVIIQYKLKALAELQITNGVIGQNFRKLMRLWTLLGIPAFTAVLILFWLMVFRPLPVS